MLILYSVHLYCQTIKHITMNFEQLNENILLNERVVFTLAKLRDWCYVKGYYFTGLDFYPDGIHSDYYGRYEDFCIDQWLDEEENFQRACLEYYTGINPN